MKRILSVLLCVCLLVALLPAVAPVEAEAVSGVNSLTCSGFISNPIAQKYIDTMMKYYINNNSSLQTTLNNGLSVVFMFEGGSDNYWNGTTYGGYGTTRNQAVVIVVKMHSSGNAYIAYNCENCSSIPDQPTQCTQGVGYSGSTTLMDGIYSFYTWNHPAGSVSYGAFQINANKGYYTPTTLPNGQVLGASGINIHSRSTNLAYSGSGVWSAGCQVIGSGGDSSNAFNGFMKAVAGISYNVWLSWSSKSFNTITTGITKGYYVVDRQLGMMDINGTQFGSGSLIQLYNSTALKNIAAASTTARNNAGFSLDYKDQCEFYPSYCQIQCTLEGAPINSQPCSVSTANGSENLETATLGQTFTATGIYKNLYGNYWYRITTSSGKTGYIYGGEVAYIDDIISDVKLTDAAPPNGHVQGTAFYVNGTVKSTYNKLSSVTCSIYDGLGTGGTLLDSASDTPTTNSYSLKGSAVDNATNMTLPQLGINTYVITASYLNYYATDATTLASNSGTLTLMEAYYMVVSEAVDQSTCAHTNTTYVMEESSCVSDGFSLVGCTTCGLVTEQVTSGGHAYGEWSTTRQPDCDNWGIQQRTCGNCGDVQTQGIPAKGHSYTGKRYDATCQEYARWEYTCGVCGDRYNLYADELMSQWSESVPEGIDPSMVESKTQYRYSDYETFVSQSPSMEGYELLGKEWVSAGSGYLAYVSQWDAGYDTSHSLYATYNKSRLTSSETDTDKTVAGSLDRLVGYVYYHWCRGTYTGGPINRTTSKTKTDTYCAFHSFYASKDTMDPTTLTAASDGSVTYGNGDCCKDSHWYYYIPVYEQSYSKYTASFTYARWTDFTQWSDTKVVASDTRVVEQRVLYRYSNAQLGDHSYVDGYCSVCGVTDPNWLTLKPSYPTLSLEGEIIMNIYFQVEDLRDLTLEDLGMITFDTEMVDGDITNSTDYIPGATFDGTYYIVGTHGIPAKQLGDTIYFKLYAKLDEGKYVYSDLYSYSPRLYAQQQLARGDAKMKTLAVAMLNYGAAAQKLFDYNADNLINAGLTAEQKALVRAYSSDMVSTVYPADSSKAGAFASNGGYSGKFPRISFDGAFSINYYFTVSLPVDYQVTMYYWDAEAYNSNLKLAAKNATGRVAMVPTGEPGEYTAAVEGIVAQQIDDAVYVAAVYESDGVSYSTGVLAYSLGFYCKSLAENPNAETQELAAATAVYGYYAREYFSSL